MVLWDRVVRSQGEHRLYVGALALAAWMCAGCDEAPPPDLEIARNQRPAPSCELVQSPTGELLTHGTFDVAIGDRSSYLLTPVVRNRTDTQVTITTARVDIELETPPDVWNRVRVRCDLGEVCEEWDLSTCNAADPTDCPVVRANDSAAFAVSILPRVVTGYFQMQLDAAVLEGRTPPEYELRSTVRLIGHSDRGDIESTPFAYELTLCLGCLVEFPPGSDSTLSGPDCCAGTPTSTSCYPGQDDPIDCRLCVRTSPEVCNFGRLTCGI